MCTDSMFCCLARPSKNRPTSTCVQHMDGYQTGFVTTLATRLARLLSQHIGLVVTTDTTDWPGCCHNRHNRLAWLLSTRLAWLLSQQTGLVVVHQTGLVVVTPDWPGCCPPDWPGCCHNRLAWLSQQTGLVVAHQTDLVVFTTGSPGSCPPHWPGCCPPDWPGCCHNTGLVRLNVSCCMATCTVVAWMSVQPNWSVL